MEHEEYTTHMTTIIPLHDTNGIDQKKKTIILIAFFGVFLSSLICCLCVHRYKKENQAVLDVESNIVRNPNYAY
jgi:hypothetical protein